MPTSRPFPLEDGTTYLIRDTDDWYFIFNYLREHPNFKEGWDLLNMWRNVPGLNSLYTEWQREQQAYANNHGNPNDVNYELGSMGITPNSTNENALANSQAQYNTQVAQDFSNYQMNNSLLSAASQLQQIGLSPSSVIQTGGSVANGVDAAGSYKGSAASLKQQAKLNRYNQQMGLAKSLIGAAGSMASSGIYGAALGAVKHSASAIAGAAAHSGLKALQATSKMSAADNAVWDDIAKSAKSAEKARNKRLKAIYGY